VSMVVMCDSIVIVVIEHVGRRLGFLMHH